MEERNYIINLYDVYGELLTDHQKKYFEDYYFNNLSLSELSENYNISRNGVHKQVKDAEEKLKKYEEKLHLYDRNKSIEKVIKDLDKKMQEEIISML